MFIKLNKIVSLKNYRNTKTIMIWPIIQTVLGIIFIITGAAGLALPVIPGVLFIVIGISLILHISLKKSWQIFRKRVLN